MAKFWQDLGFMSSMDLTDKLLVGKNADGSTQYTDLQTVYNKISQVYFADTKPSVIAAGSVLTNPNSLTCHIAPAGTYTLPSGNITLTGNINFLFWDFESGWTYQSFFVQVGTSNMADASVTAAKLDVTSVYALLSQMYFVDTKPSVIAAGSVLTTPTSLTCYIAPAGSYTLPSGNIMLNGFINFLFWDFSAGWTYISWNEGSIDIEGSSKQKYASEFSVNQSYLFAKQIASSGLQDFSYSIIASSTPQIFVSNYNLFKGQSYKVIARSFTSTTPYSLQIFGIKNGVVGVRQLLVYNGFGTATFTATDNFDQIRIVFDSLTNTSDATFTLGMQLNDNKLSMNDAVLSTDIEAQSKQKYTSEFSVNQSYLFAKQIASSGLQDFSYSIIASSTPQIFVSNYNLYKGQSYKVIARSFTSTSAYSLQIFGIKNGVVGIRQLLVYNGFGTATFTATDNFDQIRIVFDSLTNTSDATFTLGMQLNDNKLSKNDISGSTVGTSTTVASSESAVGLVNFRRFGQRLFSRYQEFDLNWYTRAQGIEDIKVYTDDLTVNYHISIIRLLTTSASQVFRLTEYVGNTITAQMLINKAEVPASKIITKQFSTDRGFVEVTIDFNKVTVEWNNASDLLYSDMVMTLSRNRFISSIDNSRPDIITTAVSYAVANRTEMNLYFQSLLFPNTIKLYANASSSLVLRRDRYLKYQPTAVNADITVNFNLINRNGKTFATKNKLLKVYSASGGSGVLSICGAGDSYFNEGVNMKWVYNQFATDADFTSVQQVGTRVATGVSGGVLVEGRSGWTAADYLNLDSKNGVVNAFRKAGQLDFVSYLADNGFTNGIKLFYWNLGVNDIGFSTRIATDVEVAAVITTLKAIFTKVFADLPTTRVILNLPCAGGAFFKDALNEQSYRFYNIQKLAKAYVENFDAFTFNNRLILSDCSQWIDPINGYDKLTVNTHSILTGITEEINNDPVHPNYLGYQMQAQGMYAAGRAAINLIP